MQHLTTEQSIEHVILEDITRHQKRFVSEAVRQWDIDGTGCFAEYVRDYIFLKWVRMARMN